MSSVIFVVNVVNQSIVKMAINNIDVSAPFWSELKDRSRTIFVNGNPMPHAYYNLIVSIRDVKLYAVGMKPHRFWKITDVKKYFGIKGDAVKLKEQLEFIQYVLTNTETDEES